VQLGAQLGVGLTRVKLVQQQQEALALRHGDRGGPQRPVAGGARQAAQHLDQLQIAGEDRRQAEQRGHSITCRGARRGARNRRQRLPRRRRLQARQKLCR
jgi:hypothetical protein